MIRRVAVVVSLVFASFVVPFRAEAAPIVTFNFTATQIFAQTPGGLPSLAAPFTTISGSISYDLATAPSSSTASFASYPTGTLTVNQFNVGTGVFAGPFFVNILNNFGASGDGLVLATPGLQPGTPPGLFDFAQLALNDSAGNTLTSTALPSNLSLFPNGNTLGFSRIQVGAGGAGVTLGTTAYTLTSLQLAPTTTPVPEPASMTLLGLGLASLGTRRWRRRRSG